MNIGAQTTYSPFQGTLFGVPDVLLIALFSHLTGPLMEEA